jgi:hypothetical protein
MSAADGRGSNAADERSAEERAEQLMERAAREGARLFGRLREEVEDIVAEVRSMHERSGSAGN